MTQFRILATGFLFYAGFGYFLPAHADDAAKDFRIISCDKRKLILEYVPEFPSVTTFSVAGKTYVSVQVNMCGNFNEEGKR